MGSHDKFWNSKNTEARYTNTVFKGVEGHLDDNGNHVTSGKSNTIAPIDEDYYTGVGSGFTVNEPFVQDATWVRLREVTLDTLSMEVNSLRILQAHGLIPQPFR